MGGVLGTIVGVVALVLLYGTGHPILFSIGVAVAIVEFASWQHMYYFAKVLARDRHFCEKLASGELGAKDSMQAAAYWDHLTRTIGMKDTIARDIQDIPNWITTVNMVAFAAVVLLAVCGIIIRLTG